MEKEKHSGGARIGAGRKSKYGEPVKKISAGWVPESKIPEIKELIKNKLKEYEKRTD